MKKMEMEIPNNKELLEMYLNTLRQKTLLLEDDISQIISSLELAQERLRVHEQELDIAINKLKNI